MKMFVDVTDIYLHKAPADFRKGINGVKLDRRTTYEPQSIL